MSSIRLTEEMNALLAAVRAKRIRAEMDALTIKLIEQAERLADIQTAYDEERMSEDVLNTAKKMYADDYRSFQWLQKGYENSIAKAGEWQFVAEDK